MPGPCVLRTALEKRCQDEPYASCLRAPGHGVAATELLVLRVEDGEVDVRPPAVVRGDGPFEAKSPGSVGADTAAPVWAVPVGPRLPEDDERPRDGRTVGPKTRPFRTCPVPIFARRGTFTPPCWKGPAPSLKVGRQIAAGAPEAVNARPVATAMAIARQASDRNIVSSIAPSLRSRIRVLASARREFRQRQLQRCSPGAGRIRRWPPHDRPSARRSSSWNGRASGCVTPQICSAFRISACSKSSRPHVRRDAAR